MTDRIAFDLLRQARDPRAHSSGSQIWSTELRPVVDELRRADPETGKPEGVFSEAALALLQGRDVDGTRGIRNGECSGPGKRVLDGAITEAAARLWRPGGGGEVRPVPVKDGHPVFLTPGAGFAVDANGTRPADTGALGDALFHAGEWVQASFGSNDNLFSTAQMDIAGKTAVLDQFKAALEGDLARLNGGQKQQLLGNIAGLTVELIKSVEINGRAPVNPAQQRALITDAFNMMTRVLDDSRLGLDVKQMLVGYLQGSDSFLAQLEPAQRKAIDARHEQYNPKTPFNYAEWDRIGKNVIRVDDIEGGGEGFIEGFVLWLQERGLGDGNWRNGGNKLQLINGDSVNGPALLRVTVAANDPINAWGRPMTVEINVSEFNNNMFRGLGREDVDITGYNGHSGFARNTLKSLPNMPEQKGDKMFYRFVCAGVDAENTIALRAPKAFANSYTTQDSGYFRTREGAHGKYAYEAEGWEGIRAMIRGVLGKKDHAQIQSDLKAHANWYGHTPGNDNNFVGPGDKRRGGSGDWDQDGIPNMYDVMPTVNLFNVQEDSAREFELRVPNVPVDQIKGDRAFQAIQFVDTATNYSALIQDFNPNRKINAHPEGVWFDGRAEPRKLVKLSEGANGKVHVQLSSALSNMTIESLRAVLFYETSRYLIEKHNPRTLPTQADRVAANLLFVQAALEYDMSYRDDAVFNGIRKLYGIPDSVGYDAFRGVAFELAERHNYGGDLTALRKILDRHREALGRPGVGENAVAVIG